ncbi:phosphatase PAP2 family protein [Sphingorhabdus sp. Alg231-15]|uniref:phosphatase PAP2 family protein n=1 Tax=Sphingorhabdus sp. Alg231-15 TaxID=1922222 RepID=UPI00307BF497
MFDLNFNESLLTFIAQYRSEYATKIVQAITFMGEINGYLIVVALLYTMVGKRLAVQSSIVVLVAMIANHLLKTLIQNPRPFVSDGTHMENWAVSPSRAAELAAEFSTPSGHAMAAAAFYLFLVFRTKSWIARYTLILAAILIGLSRPILGVHYAEDILIGWLLGGGIAVLASSHIDRLWNQWRLIRAPIQIALTAAVSISVWVITIVATQRPVAELPVEFISVLGFLTGVLLAAPIEANRVDFTPKGASVATKAFRFVLMMTILAGAILLLDALTTVVGTGHGAYESGLRYLRYIAVGAIGVLAVPWTFVQLRNWNDNRRN